MRNLVWALIPLFLMPAPADAKLSKTNQKLLEWCFSQFPSEEGKSAKPLPRPDAKPFSFELTGAQTPPDLITRTEIVGTLPSEIMKYKGQWTSPAHGEAAHMAIFVERLSPTEMTIAMAFRQGLRVERGPSESRALLKWTGERFSSSEAMPDGSATLDAYVSTNGEAMVVVSASSRVVTIEDETGKKSSHSTGDAWPACFLSEKYYH